MKVANYLRGLAKIKDGPPAYLRRKAVTTVVIPIAIYGTECWYGGRTKLATHVTGVGNTQIEMRSSVQSWRI